MSSWSFRPYLFDTSFKDHEGSGVVTSIFVTTRIVVSSLAKGFLPYSAIIHPCSHKLNFLSERSPVQAGKSSEEKYRGTIQLGEVQHFPIGRNL